MTSTVAHSALQGRSKCLSSLRHSGMDRNQTDLGSHRLINTWLLLIIWIHWRSTSGKTHTLERVQLRVGHYVFPGGLYLPVGVDLGTGDSPEIGGIWRFGIISQVFCIADIAGEEVPLAFYLACVWHFESNAPISATPLSNVCLNFPRGGKWVCQI